MRSLAPDFARSGEPVRREAALIAALTRTVDLAKLPDNWDSYGASPPSSAAIAGASAALVAICEAAGTEAGYRPLPWAISPFPGGIQFEWRDGDGALSVDVDAAGRYGYLLVTGAGADASFREQDDVSLDTILALAAEFLAP